MDGVAVVGGLGEIRTVVEKRLVAVTSRVGETSRKRKPCLDGRVVVELAVDMWPSYYEFQCDLLC